jgi:hypothetical protein
LLQRAGFPTDACLDLCKQIAEQEQSELLRSFGRIEPRNRFPNLGSHPLLVNAAVNVLSLDECGQSHARLTSGQTVFSLGGVALDEEQIGLYKREADAVKRAFFGTVDITFHEPEIRRREGLYYFRGDQHTQREFDSALGSLIGQTQFVAFGAVIRKDAFHNEFGGAGIDPCLPTDVYTLAIMLLMERYIDFLAMSGQRRRGRVVFESQGAREDALHQLECAR